MSRLASRRNDIKWGNEAKKGRGNPNFSGGKYMDDKGYIRILCPEHVNNVRGYMYEHRLMLEKYLGRLLLPWESVHHINEIKIDNRIENLFLTTVAEHSAIHREGKRKTLAQRTHMRNKVRAKMAKKGGARRTHDGRFVQRDESVVE